MDLDDIKAAVSQAGKAGGPLYIAGANTKAHLGYPVPDGAAVFSVADYRGVIDYHPEELVVRVRAGTPVKELVETLRREGQMPGFEPPDHDDAATIGGVIAAGLSGSRRPFAGSARDFVLGVGLVLADGSYREFGGQVMKNVAGYDISRLVCGSFGTLALLADVSLKVLPLPERERSVAIELSTEDARQRVSDMRSGFSCLSGCCYTDGQLRLRFAGSAASVQAEIASVGGEELDNGFWRELDRQALPGIAGRELWRLSTDPEEPFTRDFAWMDWCFGQRWLLDPPADPRDGYEGAGHWTRYTAGQGAPFSDPSPGLKKLHRRIKQAFDPNGFLNPSRMYEGI